MADEARSDAAVRHFRSRAAQPKTLASGAGANPRQAATPLQVNIVFDHPGCSSDYGRVAMSDQVDVSRYNYVGTSQLPRSCLSAKRLGFQSMCDGFLD